MSQRGILNALKKSLTPSYKHLSAKQKRIVKADEKRKQAERFLYGHKGFFETVGRLENSAVNWDIVPNETQLLVSRSLKEIEAFNRIDEVDADKALLLFQQTQSKLSQSF